MRLSFDQHLDVRLLIWVGLNLRDLNPYAIAGKIDFSRNLLIQFYRLR